VSEPEYITGHMYWGDDQGSGPCEKPVRSPDGPTNCGYPRSLHADPGVVEHFVKRYPHDFLVGPEGGDHCTYASTTQGETDPTKGGVWRVCGYPRSEHRVPSRVQARDEPCQDPARCDVHGHTSAVVRVADVAEYARQPMPDAARSGIVVTLIDAPVDPLGTLAVIGGIYSGKVARSKAEVTDEERRAMLADMQATVLDGPLEAIQFTFLLEGVSRSFTHQAVRNRFSFFAQESLRFAVAEDWAQEVPLPPSLAGRGDGDAGVGVWRKAMNQSEDNYATLVALGMPAEEARDVLVHAITTRYYWTVSLRTLLQEAGKRTCTQAQFHWRQAFAGVAKAFRQRDHGEGQYVIQGGLTGDNDPHPWKRTDVWQYEAFAGLIRPVCYQQGGCGFMAKFDRGCTIRARVDANERLGRPSSEWSTEYDVVPPEEVVVGVGPKSVVVDRDGTTPLFVGAIDPREWAADPSAARVFKKEE